MADLSAQLQQQVAMAIDSGHPLRITGGGGKAFLCPDIDARELAVAEHSGIIDYQPTELVLTARAGTRLSEIEAALTEHGQMLPFEPPHFSPQATLGGAIACALSGSIRPFTGSARDFVLGCRILNGHAQCLHFGGKVMKNVAGYDVSRLMAGAMGSLGVLLEISIKVLPAFPSQCSLIQQRQPADALRLMQTLSTQNLPLSGLAYDGEQVHIRLAGSESSVAATRRKLGGEQQPDRFWRALNEQTHPFFDGDSPLWRLSLPVATPWLDMPGKQLIDWAGGLRWLRSRDPAESLFRIAARHQGHARLFRSPDGSGPRLHALSPALLALHRRIKASFDPHRLFNPGILYPEL